MLLRLSLIIALVAMSFFVPPAYAIVLPKPGTMVALSAASQPVLIKGLKLHADNPLQFDFIIDTGSKEAALDTSSATIQNESNKLIKYFLAALTIPEKDLWVNLSPFEQDRKMSDNLAQTQMGQDMLAQDYLLKQLSASLIYPEKGLGKKFWDKIYQEISATKHGGLLNVPISTFNKVWIVAETADVYEGKESAYVTKAHLKVMMEQDYLAREKHSVGASSQIISPSHHPSPRGVAGDKAIVPLIAQSKQSASETLPFSRSISQEILKEIILPAIEKEVNEGENFAPLRQMYYSMILATWYKMRLKESLITRAYGNQSKVGVTVNALNPNDTEEIFQKYLQAYKKGVFNFIKDDASPDGASTPRKYFSGGLEMNVDKAMRVIPVFNAPPIVGEALQVAVNFKPYLAQNHAMTTFEEKPRHVVVVGDPSLNRELDEIGHFSRSISDVTPAEILKLNHLFMEEDESARPKGVEVIVAPRSYLDIIEPIVERIKSSRNVNFAEVRRVYYHAPDYNGEKDVVIKKSEMVFIVSGREVARDIIATLFAEQPHEREGHSIKQSLDKRVGDAVNENINPFAGILNYQASNNIKTKKENKSSLDKKKPLSVQQSFKKNQEVAVHKKVLFALDYFDDSMNEELRNKVEKLLRKEGFMVVVAHGDLEATTILQQQGNFDVVLSFRGKYRQESLEAEALRHGLKVVAMSPISKPNKVLQRIYNVVDIVVSPKKVLYVTSRVRDQVKDQIALGLERFGHHVIVARGLEHVKELSQDHQDFDVVLGFNQMFQRETLPNIAASFGAQLIVASNTSQTTDVIGMLKKIASSANKAMLGEKLYENKRILLVRNELKAGSNMPTKEELNIIEYLEKNGAQVKWQDENIVTNPWGEEKIDLIVGFSIQQSKLDHLAGLFKLEESKKTIRVSRDNISGGKAGQWFKEFIVSMHNIMGRNNVKEKILVISRLERSSRREKAIAHLNRFYDVFIANSGVEASEMIEAIKPGIILLIHTLHAFTDNEINKIVDSVGGIRFFNFEHHQNVQAKEIVNDVISATINEKRLLNTHNEAMNSPVEAGKNILVINDHGLHRDLQESNGHEVLSLDNVSVKDLQNKFDQFIDLNKANKGIEIIVAPFVLKDELEEVLFILSRRNARFGDIKRIYYEPPSNQKRQTQTVLSSDKVFIVPDRFSVSGVIAPVSDESKMTEIEIKRIDYTQTPVLLVTVGDTDELSKKDLGFKKDRYKSIAHHLPLNQFNVVRADVVRENNFERKISHIFEKYHPQHIIFDINGNNEKERDDNVHIAAQVIKFIKEMPDRGEIKIFYKGQELGAFYGSTTFGLNIQYFDSAAVLKQSLERDLALKKPALKTRGGIDLNAQKMHFDVVKEGSGSNLIFDAKTLDQFHDRNFSGIVYRIQRITPISNITQLLQ